jgi:hypothetical protein
MKTINLLLASICILSITACTNQVAYDSVKGNLQNDECHHLPSSARDECIGQRNQSYDDYEKNRQDMLNEDN